MTSVQAIVVTMPCPGSVRPSTCKAKASWPTTIWLQRREATHGAPFLNTQGPASHLYRPYPPRSGRHSQRFLFAIRMVLISILLNGRRCQRTRSTSLTSFDSKMQARPLGGCTLHESPLPQLVLGQRSPLRTKIRFMKIIFHTTPFSVAV